MSFKHIGMLVGAFTMAYSLAPYALADVVIEDDSRVTIDKPAETYEYYSPNLDVVRRIPETTVDGSDHTVTIPDDVLKELGWVRADSLPDGNNNLSFPPAVGTVFFEHEWAPGDIPSVYASPGGPGGAIITAGNGNKFRTEGVDGTMEVVSDPQLDYVVRMYVDTTMPDATHHTMLEPLINGKRWGLPTNTGNLYIIEYWRKDINRVPDSKWELDFQVHGWPDSGETSPLNPPVGLSGGDNGSWNLTVIGDDETITTKSEYDRSNKYDILPNDMDEDWHLWTIEITCSPSGPGGYLRVSRDNQVLYQEANKPICFKDAKGQILSFGIYKYLNSSTYPNREALIGPIRYQVK